MSEPSIVNRPRPLRSLTASAARLTSDKIKTSSRSGTDSWQNDAWEMYDLVGELRFLATTLANRMGQARLFVGELPDDATQEPVPVEGDLDDILDTVGGGNATRGQMITRLGMNLFIAGDAWLVGVPRWLMPTSDGMPRMRPDSGLDGVALGDLEWFPLSVDEVRQQGTGEVTLSIGGEGGDEKVVASVDDLYLMRIWRSHPRKAWEADSPTRASLPVLRELVGLTMHISAQVDSRLAGAGLLLIPQSAQRALREFLGLAEGDTTDPFLDALMEAMLTPISDRASASAIVPLAVTVPDEVTNLFNFITFDKPLDTEARPLREEAIRRLALGLDASPELLLGTSGMNHWGAWLVREDVVTTHIEPPLALICDALTTQFLWPVLIDTFGYSEDEAHRYVIWYDVSHMIMRPNRAADAQVLYDKGVLSDKTLREANGFDDSDAPAISEDTQDPAIETALGLVAKAPTLMSSPGLEAVVAAIRRVMSGEDVTDPLPAPAEPEPTAEPEEPPADDTSEPSREGDLPDTIDDPAEQPSSPDVAASVITPDGYDGHVAPYFIPHRERV